MNLQSLKLFFLLFSFTLWFSEICPETTLNDNDLVDDIASSIRKSLNYLNTVQNHLTLDALLGIQIAADQTRVLSKLFICSNQNKSNLIILNQQANELINKSLVSAFLREPIYFQSVGRLLSSRLWSSVQMKPLHLSGEVPKLKNLHNKFYHFSLNESLSDYCFGEVLNECKISYFCGFLLIKQNYAGYRQAHQALYLLIVKMMNCPNWLSPNELKAIDRKIERLCKIMFSDNLKIEQGHYLNEDQDLFMENIFICGYNGFTSFREKKDWLREILKWQNKLRGCFKIDQLKLANFLTSEERRLGKRRETVFADGCSLHKTSMALATASIFLQQLIITSIIPNTPDCVP